MRQGIQLFAVVAFFVSLFFTAKAFSQDVQRSPQRPAAALPATCIPETATQAAEEIIYNNTVYVCSGADSWTKVNAGAAIGLDTTWKNNLRVQGPIPWTDVSAYARPVFTGWTPTATASCTKGSKIIRLTKISNEFRDNDGITIRGCGATNTMNTPTAPTVLGGQLVGADTHMEVYVAGPKGNAKYQYQVIARDKYGAYTAASPVTTIANGPTKLGNLTYHIVSISRANDVVVVVTSEPNVLEVGAAVQIKGVPAQQFDGMFNVSKIDSHTQFEIFNTPLDSRNTGFYAGDAPSQTSGQVSTFVENVIKVAPVPGAWEYYTYGQRPGEGSMHLIGTTRPQGLNGYMDTTVEDYGSPFMDNQTFPSYIPTMPPSTASNDPLTTTIVSGAPGASIVVADPALQTTGEEFAIFDNAPGILKAANAATYHGCCTEEGTIYFPPGGYMNGSYVVNSFLPLPPGVNIKQAGPIVTTETIEVQGGSVWDGSWSTAAGEPQFAFEATAELEIAAANPGVYLYGQGPVIRHMTILGEPANGGLMVMADSAQPLTIEDSTISCSTSANDTDCQDVVLRENSQTIANHYFNKVFFGGGPDQIPDKSWTPLFYVAPSGGNTEYNVSFNITQIGSRGYAIYQTGGGSGFQFSDFCYRQGGISPFFLDYSTAGPVSVSFGGCQQDTETEPTFANLTNVPQYAPLERGTANLNASGGAGDPLISGTRLQSFVSNWSYTGANPMPNREGVIGAFARYAYPANSPTGVGPCGSSSCMGPMAMQVFDETVAFGAKNSLIWSMLRASNVSAIPTPGGSYGPGAIYYAVVGVGRDGGLSAPSLPSKRLPILPGCPTSGNCSVKISWAGALGSTAYNVYACYADSACVTSSGVANGSANWYRLSEGITTNSFTDNGSGYGHVATVMPEVGATGVTIANDKGVSSPLFACPETAPPAPIPNFDIFFCNENTHSPSTVNSTGVITPLGGGTIVVAAGKSVLRTSSIASGSCAPFVTAAAIGARVGDNVIADFIADASGIAGYGNSNSGVLTLYKQISEGNVLFKVCNWTSRAITPGPAVMQWRVIR